MESVRLELIFRMEFLFSFSVLSFQNGTKNHLSTCFCSSIGQEAHLKRETERSLLPVEREARFRCFEKVCNSRFTWLNSLVVIAHFH